MEKEDYIAKTVGLLMPKDDEALAAEVGASLYLDGVYSGDSPRIARMVRVAYLRGVRRGAAAAWSARQPITTRDVVPPSNGNPVEAAKRADWQQVVLNGGPPCFHLEAYGTFCLRAERWHNEDTHEFRPLHRLLAELQTPTPAPGQRGEEMKSKGVDLIAAERRPVAGAPAYSTATERRQEEFLRRAWDPEPEKDKCEWPRLSIPERGALLRGLEWLFTFRHEEYEEDEMKPLLKADLVTLRAIRSSLIGEGRPEPEKQPLPKMVRITRARPDTWYGGRLGEVFHVHSINAATDPLVIGPGGDLWAVAKSDCEPVPDEGQG